MRETVPKIRVVSERVIGEQGGHGRATLSSIKNQNQHSNVYWNGLLKKNKHEEEKLLGDGRLKQQLGKPFLARDCLGSSSQLEDAEQNPKRQLAEQMKTNYKAQILQDGPHWRKDVAAKAGLLRGSEPGIRNAERAR